PDAGEGCPDAGERSLGSRERFPAAGEPCPASGSAKTSVRSGFPASGEYFSASGTTISASDPSFLSVRSRDFCVRSGLPSVPGRVLSVRRGSLASGDALRTQGRDRSPDQAEGGVSLRYRVGWVPLPYSSMAITPSSMRN